MLPMPTTSYSRGVYSNVRTKLAVMRALAAGSGCEDPATCLRRWESVTEIVAAARRASSSGDTLLRQQRTGPPQPSTTFAAPSATGHIMMRTPCSVSTLSHSVQRANTGALAQRSSTRALPLRLTAATPRRRRRGMGGAGGDSMPAAHSTRLQRSRSPPQAATPHALT